MRASSSPARKRQDLSIERFCSASRRSTEGFAEAELVRGKHFGKRWAAKKLLRLLTCDFEELPAFKAGVIDSEGCMKVKIRDLTLGQKACFGPFERLALKLRRLLNKSSVSSVSLLLSHLEAGNHDDFDSIVMNLTDDARSDAEEDAPTTSVSGVAGTAVPLRVAKRREEI